MSTQTVTQAVEKRDTAPAEIVRQSRAWFATIVPSHIDASAFVALALANLRKNPKLADAATRNPQAFMACLSECARLGLVPGDTFHCVPFENRRNGTVDITGIVDYKGEIELMYRAGAVASVKAEIVYSRDRFRFTTDMDKPEHAPDWFGDRGELIGAYAYAVMKDGATSKVVVYSKAQIDEVRAVSKTQGKPDSPWEAWYDRMALKTVLHRLDHFVPTSAEYRREQLRAAAEIAQQVNSAPVTAPEPAAGNGHPAADATVYDAEIVPDPEPPRTVTAQEVNDHFKVLGYTARDQKEVLHAAGVLAGRKLPLASVADLTGDQLAAVAATLEGCGSRGDVVALLAEASGDAAAERVFKAGEADG